MDECVELVEWLQSKDMSQLPGLVDELKELGLEKIYRLCIVMTALRVAMKLTDPLVTDVVLRIVPMEDLVDQRNPDVCDLVSKLFLEHKLQGRHITSDSIMIAIQIIQMWFPSSDVHPEFLDRLSKLLDFESETVFPLLTDDFWTSFIKLVVFNAHISTGTSILKNFALSDFPRYSALTSSIMQDVGYREEITSGDNIEILAKTYQYLKRFS